MIPLQLVCLRVCVRARVLVLFRLYPYILFIGYFARKDKILSEESDYTNQKYSGTQSYGWRLQDI